MDGSFELVEVKGDGMQEMAQLCSTELAQVTEYDYFAYFWDVNSYRQWTSFNQYLKIECFESANELRREDNFQLFDEQCVAHLLVDEEEVYTDSIFQEFEVKPNSDYYWSFSIYSPKQISQIELTIGDGYEDNDKLFIQYFTTVDAKWTTYNGVYRTKKEQNHIYIAFDLLDYYNYDNNTLVNSEVYLDQVTISLINGNDSDRDGFSDCQEVCIFDSQKSGPGQCGCGIPDIDSDGDGYADCVDDCVNDASLWLSPGCEC